MTITNPNFVAESAIYDAIRAQSTAEARFHAIVEENNLSCASYVPLTNHRAARWDDDSQFATVFLVDLTSTGDGQGVDSSEEE
ncbi:Hydroxymethylglutaryl-CoA lyase, mitochondrial [Hordeum vulgare]|nr:Hydroxymethylglutaryl-CoA lyase, mitochondrial [Hordeum vulgare]